VDRSAPPEHAVVSIASAATRVIARVSCATLVSIPRATVRPWRCGST
jgi:hypothetical protein